MSDCVTACIVMLPNTILKSTGDLKVINKNQMTGKSNPQIKGGERITTVVSEKLNWAPHGDSPKPSSYDGKAKTTCI